MAKHKKRRIRFGRILALLLVVLLGIAGYMYSAYKKALRPVSEVSENILFTVNAGETAKTAAQHLEEAGLIRDAGYSYLYAKRNGLTDLKAGDYLIDRSWDTDQIFTVLNDPRAAITDDAVVTIIEGDWVKHIAQKIAAATDVSEDELMELWNDKSYVKSLMADYPFLTEEMFDDSVRILMEGYLAPNTYLFFRSTSADEVTRKILDESLNVYRSLEKEIKKSDLSVHEIYTLASIVQYESGKPDDMKKIAGVFFNRMKTGMPLQSSVTVCYAIDINKGDDWQACEMNPTFDSPYNTYMYGGLPPGPIENPGRDAIEAVLDPDQHDYYFFMADVYGDGKVYYAKTLEEHEANVRKYLK